MWDGLRLGPWKLGGFQRVQHRVDGGPFGAGVSTAMRPKDVVRHRKGLGESNGRQT